MRRCETINLIHYRRGRGQLKTSWNEVIRGDLKFMGLTENMARDRSQWSLGLRLQIIGSVVHAPLFGICASSECAYYMAAFISSFC